MTDNGWDELDLKFFFWVKIGLVVIAVLTVMFFVAIGESSKTRERQYQEFMIKCMEDKKDYECQALYG